jgi:hypothetical protein
MKNRNMIMIASKPATGKTASLRNMDKEKTVYLNIDGKRVPFPKEFKHSVQIDDIQTLLPTLQQIEDSEEVEFVVIDTLNFAMDMFETQLVVTARDTQKAWGEYGQFYKRLIAGIKASKKKWVVLAHNKDIYNEDEMAIETKVPVAGKIGARGVEADFETILNSVKIKDDSPKGFSYKFQTQLTKDTLNLNIRHPMGMWSDEELYIDNDITLVFDKIEEYYGK